MKHELSYTPFYKSFIALCEKAGKSPTAVAKEAGLSAGSPTAWKNGAVPKKIQREKLCQYFSVTEQELLGYKEKPAGSLASEFSENYNLLSDENKKIIDDLVEKLLMSQSSQ